MAEKPKGVLYFAIHDYLDSHKIIVERNRGVSFGETVDVVDIVEDTDEVEISNDGEMLPDLKLSDVVKATPLEDEAVSRVID